MFKISSELLSKIQQSLNNNLSGQKGIFEAMDLNPYDDFDGDLDADRRCKTAMYRVKYEMEKEERTKYADSFFLFSEMRCEEIMAGAELTQDEEHAVHEAIFEDDDSFAVISELSDGERSLFTLTMQQIQGQGGLHILEFLGFYESEKSAEDALESMDRIVTV